MKNILKIIVVVLLGSFTAARAAALPSENRGVNNFEGRMGLAIPLTGDLEDVASTGFQVGADWLHRVSPLTSFGAGIDFISYGEESIGGVDVDVDMFSIMGLVRRELASRGSSQPYLLGGVGVTQTNLDVSAGSGFSPSSDSEDDTSLSFLVGAGVDFPLSNGLLLGFVGRYQQYLFDIGNIDGGGTLQLLGQLRW